jgi:hypothetical protein
MIILFLAACSMPAISLSTPTPAPKVTSAPTAKPTSAYITLKGGMEAQTAHCRVINDGFSTSYTLAWANVCEVSYEAYQEIYGLDALTLYKSNAIVVHLVPEKQTKPSLDAYAGKITFRGNETHLLAPADGGANNIYGICHEIGHLVFPIADPAYFEAWADYAAAYRIIPYVWERLGADAWPQPYDYLVNDGPADLRQRSKDGTGSTDMVGDHYRAVNVLISVDETYGTEAMGQAIRQMKKPMKLSDFEEALVSVTKDQAARNLFVVTP